MSSLFIQWMSTNRVATVYYHSTMAVWWSKKKAVSSDVRYYLSQIPAHFKHYTLIHIPLLSLFLHSSLCATEWCDSREQTMSGYPGNLGRRTEVSWAGSAPSSWCGASATDDSPACTMKVGDPNLSKAGGGGVGEQGRWGRGIIRRRGWWCLRQWHLLIGRCPCPWHK